jgi:trans-aconitate 2-methyltransferase
MTFEFDAEKYKKASLHQKEWGKKLISKLSLKGNEKILDLGCGDGVITAQLAELVPDGLVIGIDASGAMVELAQKTHKIKNIRFILMDINTINFADEFDVVFSNATLHWIKDHKRLLKKAFKGLKAGGIIRFNFAADGNCSTFIRVVREVMLKEKYMGYFNQFDWPWYMPTIDEYRKLLEQFSFKEARVWGENADRSFQNKDEMIGWVEQPSLVPFLKYVADADKQSFRNAVVERMVEETLQADGACFETFRRINVFAKK